MNGSIPSRCQSAYSYRHGSLEHRCRRAGHPGRLTRAVLQTLGKTGDFKDGVFKVNIPRNDLRVTISRSLAPTPFGFGGWVALTQGEGMEVMMGDLMLAEDEVSPVMSALLQNGFEVTALHNHFFWEQPRIFYMHVHGAGSAGRSRAKCVKPAIALIDQAARTRQARPAAAPAPSSATLDGAALAKIIGIPGEQADRLQDHHRPSRHQDAGARATINARMGLNTWAAFAGTDADAMVAGDVAMLEHE